MTVPCRFLCCSPAATCIAADESVSEMYGAKMSKNFSNHGVEVHYVVLPGEEVRLSPHSPKMFRPHT